MEEKMNLINNKISYEDSLYLYKAVQPTSLSNEGLPPEKAYNKDFFDDFPGNLIQKPQYSDCRFYGSNFNSSNGAYSKFHHCSLFDCHLDNCDFRYSDFLQTKVVCDEKKAIRCV